MRNPKWTRDELILALDLYFRNPPGKISSDHPEIVQLSALLNQLPVHPQKEKFQKFRNPNGVYMKLCNFLRFDPNYSGKGLQAGGKLEEEIWNEFAGNRTKLAQIAASIRENAQYISRPQIGDIPDDEEFQEGKVLTRLHKFRERSPSITKKKKESVLNQKGKLLCEACGFDFEKKYGTLGRGFAECHHMKPLAELRANQKTKLSDLCILCSNCHRMIHRTKPMVSLEEFKKILR